MNMLVTVASAAASSIPLSKSAATAAVALQSDPVLALIDEHKRSIAAVDDLIDVIDELEKAASEEQTENQYSR
jgi:hypothetical protein